MAFLNSRSGHDAGHPTLGVTPVGKILRARDLAALVDARGLLAQAREQAARIIENAQSAYAAERARGYAEGQEAARLEQVAAMLALTEQKAAYLKRVEEEIVELVMASMRKIFADFNDQDQVLTVVRSGLTLLRQQKQVVLRVNAADAEIVRLAMQELLAAFPGVDYIDVCADDHYPRGECRLETEVGTVQTSLQAQLAILEHAFRQVIEHFPAIATEKKDRHV
jgi:type III secretion protein L